MFKMYRLAFLVFVILVIDIKSTSVPHRKGRESVVCFKDYNYHASIRVEYDTFLIHHCCGAVLDEEHVITAASCISDLSPMDIKVVVGTEVYEPLSAVESRYPVNSVAHAYIHKKFNETYRRFTTIIDYDIAIIKTEQPLQPQGKFSMISPASSAIKIPDGQHATMTLWKVGGSSNYNKLSEKDGRKANDYQCGCVYSDSVSPQMVCYDFDEGCYGESGAPLTMVVEENFILIGIYSWHGDCGNLTYPAVFTKISEFDGWIHDVVTYMPPKAQCKPLHF